MGEGQPRHHLSARRKAWAPQRDKMCRDIGKACRWRNPGAAALEGRGDEAVCLDRLRRTRVGCLVTLRRPPRRRRWMTARVKRAGRAPLKNVFSSALPFVLSFGYLSMAALGRRREGSLTRTAMPVGDGAMPMWKDNNVAGYK